MINLNATVAILAVKTSDNFSEPILPKTADLKPY